MAAEQEELPDEEQPQQEQTEDEWATTRNQMVDALPAVTEPVPGGLAYDLVTRQLLFIRRQVSENLVDYMLEESFDLLNYNEHPYLPVQPGDAVYECVFLADVTAKTLDDWADADTYDFPRGRLAVVPVQEAWG